ncbi:MAG: hypothetical protein AUK55_05660 [Syntrophobacteraceae bacterium CG2_30_61_12]|nr:MAG: hypothetical protein AUK55_05660 [Syntrophobacteraceae bacterium CG2_30_61_12]
MNQNQNRGQDHHQDRNQDAAVYRRLADHLNRLPAGFPATPTGVELKVLKRLFTPDQARLAQQLTLKPETPDQIAERCRLTAAELAPQLEDLAAHGLIFRIRKGPAVLYMAAQFLIGIWEYHVNDLDPELIRDMNQYIPYFFDQAQQNRTPQLRTIPVPGAVNAQQTVMAYEEARGIVGAQDKIVVAPCICRKEQRMVGKGCHRPLESCLVFGLGAQYYEDNRLGRGITRDEALTILERAEQAGLVLQPSNAQKVVNICTCCGCCCQILKNLKKLPKPAEHVMSNFVARVDADRCSGCETCLERCQMEAITVAEATAVVAQERCIGCGLCVPTCPEQAIELTAKPAELRQTPPAHLLETYSRIAAERLQRLQVQSNRGAIS